MLGELSTSDVPVGARDPAVLGIAREGWPVIAVIALVAGGAAVLAAVWSPVAGWIVGVPGGLVALWSAWFFRDPERSAPADPALMVSAADGVVCAVDRARPPSELGIEGERDRVSVFMNIFNVHVNRAPAKGRITAVEYRPGKFFNASLDKASEHNERAALAVELADGRTMAVVQIAGLVARRIVCKARPGDAVLRGERFGLIRFGSRVDVYLPPGASARVRVGQGAVAGQTVIASLDGGAR